jgi:hypothetical protein
MGYQTGDTFAFLYQGVEEKAPNASGVYVIYTPAQWVYVGQSDDLQKSLFGHLNEPGTCMGGFGPLSFSFELVPADARLARYQALLAELSPACNPGSV